MRAKWLIADRPGARPSGDLHRGRHQPGYIKVSNGRRDAGATPSHRHHRGGTPRRTGLGELARGTRRRPCDLAADRATARCRQLRTRHASRDDIAVSVWANNEVSYSAIAECHCRHEFRRAVHSDAGERWDSSRGFGANGLSAMAGLNSVAARSGCVLLRRGVTCVPMHGGGQGAMFVPAHRCRQCSWNGDGRADRWTDSGKQRARLRLLRDRLVEGVLAEIDDVCLNAPMTRCGWRVTRHFPWLQAMR